MYILSIWKAQNLATVQRNWLTYRTTKRSQTFYHLKLSSFTLTACRRKLKQHIWLEFEMFVVKICTAESRVCSTRFNTALYWHKDWLLHHLPDKHPFFLQLTLYIYTLDQRNKTDHLTIFGNKGHYVWSAWSIIIIAFPPIMLPSSPLALIQSSKGWVPIAL